jgi:phosphoribosylanthranilate isomerase
VTHVKICGIKDAAHAKAIADARADFVGLVFAPSPRQITATHAQKIVASINQKSPPETVGVFVNTPAGAINRIADSCHLDWVQLSGNEPWEYCRELDRPIIKVIRVSRNYKPEQIIADLSYGDKILVRQRHIFLIDSNVPHKLGGTGQPFNWKAARLIAERFPVIIAGGLTPKNVGEAIHLIKPWGVDVSSGVETKGAKDLDKILKFISAVKNINEETD